MTRPQGIPFTPDTTRNGNIFSPDGPFRMESGTALPSIEIAYTTLGHLHEILKCKENSPLFKRRLPLSANGNEPNMELILSDLQKLTKIRNKVMHPIGAAPPTEEDFFAKSRYVGYIDRPLSESVRNPAGNAKCGTLPARLYYLTRANMPASDSA